MREKAAKPLSTAACAVIEVVVEQQVSNSKTGFYARIHTPTGKAPSGPEFQRLSAWTLPQTWHSDAFYYV
jgi:hypothetical protein